MSEEKIQKESNKERKKRQGNGCLVVFLVAFGVIIIVALSGGDNKNKGVETPKRETPAVSSSVNKVSSVPISPCGLHPIIWTTA